MERRAYDVANRGLPLVALLGETVADLGVVTRSLENVADFFVRSSSRIENQHAVDLASQTHIRSLSQDQQAELDYRRAFQLVRQVRVRPLTKAEQSEFDRLLGRLSCRLLTGMAWVLGRGPTRQEFEQIKRLAEAAQTRELTDQEQAELKQQLDPLRQFVRREQEIRVRELWHRRKADTGARRSPIMNTTIQARSESMNCAIAGNRAEERFYFPWTAARIIGGPFLYVP